MNVANTGKKHAKKHPYGSQPIEAEVLRRLRRLEAKKERI
jgi:hypothetical protein